MASFDLVTFDQADALAKSAAIAWLNQIEAASHEGRPHYTGLSGGRITLKLFGSVIEQAKARNISFVNVHFFWADERCVPPNNPESNFAAADIHFFQPLGIAATNIHRVRGENSPGLAAQLATQEILSIAPDRADGHPVMDLIFLGMGEDGHVASLFPGEPQSAIDHKSIYRAISNSPKPPPNRVTLGYSTIAAAKQVWVLASGAGKEAALRESVKPNGQTPLARVLRLRSQTKILTDIRID